MGETEDAADQKLQPTTGKPLYTEEKKPEKHEKSEKNGFKIEYNDELLPKRLVIPLALTYYGLSVMFLVLSVEVVPSQIQSMVGQAKKGEWLGGMVAAGAILTCLSGPLFGMRSDRMTSKYGKRRPMMVIGLLFLCMGLVGMAFSAPEIIIDKAREVNNTTNSSCYVDLVAKRCAPYLNASSHGINTDSKTGWPNSGGVVVPGEDKHKITYVNQEEVTKGNIWMFIIFYLMVTVSNNSISIPYNGLIADKSHHDQRGLTSGVMGFMILFGNVSGAGVGLFFIQLGVLSVYGLVMCLAIICVSTTVFMIHEEPAVDKHEEPINWKQIILAFWEPLKENDFRWVFITRFLMQQGISTVTGFLNYWLSDMVHIPFCWSPQRAVAVVLMPLLGTAAIGSICFGILSDKIGRRKPIVICAAICMFVCSTILTFIRGENAFFIVVCLAFVFGSGFGGYSSVDFALVMDVLPDDRDRSRDIAVWHQAMVLPQAVATPIGGVLLDVFERVDCVNGLGYTILFAITAFYFILSGLLVLKIKKAK